MNPASERVSNGVGEIMDESSKWVYGAPELTMQHAERFTIHALEPRRAILRCCTCGALNIFTPDALNRVVIVETGGTNGG